MSVSPTSTLQQAVAPPEIFAQKPAPARSKKKLIRRTSPDRSQGIRRTVQIAFLLLNVAIGVQFYLWVHYYETGGATAAVSRPAGVEGWLPIAGLMNLKFFLLTHNVPSIHPAGMFLIATFLTISFLFRKAFCSWLCPVGTISEGLWKFGRRLFRRNLHLPRWTDIPLRGLKYLLLGFFLWAVGSMSAQDIAMFLHSPYGLIADVKMLNFFRELSMVGAIVIGVLVVLSIFIQNFWCRYLCPYGALMGFASLISPMRIRRDPVACIDCAKCAKACPSQLPVDTLVSIKSAECTACMECVAVCPAQGALDLALPRKRQVPVWAVAAGIAALFLGAVTYAKITTHWNTNLPQDVYYELVPNSDQATHPMPGR